MIFCDSKTHEYERKKRKNDPVRRNIVEVFKIVNLESVFPNVEITMRIFLSVAVTSVAKRPFPH